MASVPVKQLRLAALLSIGLFAALFSAAQHAEVVTTTPSSKQVVNFLTQSVDWYRSSPAKQQLPSEPEDVPFLDDTHSLTLQILRLSFDSARALAQSEAEDRTSSKQSAVIPEPSGSAPRDFTSIEAKCQTEAQTAQANVLALRNKLDTHRGKDRDKLSLALEEAETRLNLIEAECRSYQDLQDFVRGVDTNEPQNHGLASVVDELSRSVPDLANTGGPAPALQVNYSAFSNGAAIPQAISEVLKLHRKLHTLDESNRLTDRLAQSSQGLRKPLAQYLISSLQRTVLSSTDLRNSDVTVLREQKARLDALSAHMTSLAPAVVALDKQEILFGIYRSNLANWRTLVASQHASAWKNLVVHVLVFALVVILLAVISRAVRKLTIYYVRDFDRRRTFQIALRVLLGFCIALVMFFAFASNLGSFATFLGLLTAGLAVALQNVILAVLGYAVLAGKLDMRVGERVRISGVTGEIVDFGLLQFQIREIDSEGRVTGRVAAFSNSFIFVSPATGIFKLEPATSEVEPSSNSTPPDRGNLSIDYRESDASVGAT
jgi:hypothetical protein